MPDLGELKYDNLFAGHTQPAIVGSEVITGGNFKRGTVLGLITASNKMTIVDKAKSDGSQEVAAVLAQDVDASQQDKTATVYYTGQFNASSLIFKEGESATDYKLSLRKMGVFAVGFYGGVPQPAPPELRAIDTVVVFGASIMEQSFEYSESRQDFRDKMVANGLNINVFERATGGNDSVAMVAALPGIISEFQDRAATTLFVIHWGGNDLANYPANEASIEANLRGMAQDIKDAGFMIAMSNTTFRLVPPYGWESAPFNANVQQAIVDEFADIPMDMYALTFDNQDVWFESDGVHPNSVGEEINRQYISDTISPFIKNVSFSDADSLKDALIQFGSRDVMTGGLNNALNNNSVPLYNTDYTEIPNAVVSVSQSAGVNNEGRGNTGDPSNTSLTILNNEGLKDSFYSDSSFPIIIDLKSANINAGDTYTIQVTASRAATEDRFTVFTLGGNSVAINTSLDQPEYAEMQVSGIDLILNNLECKRQEGTAFGYVSMIRVINNRFS